ncbi:glycosyltransferase involved in cell wall bisynthesis [Bacillus oleivorans]|uniref:Glycosyltransferase involved in cell wall bisynthesis n=1 Tax=Bacillus oleivorans TaxID=1448271 RepID=A0A285CGR8_9BACI|nr:glycosyltransferase family 2 protein [Bacillus oleivorans]SNX66797.1 glycosyltransferase involved in cell wall bisynthesis [Bacillus oleivorans]
MSNYVIVIPALNPTESLIDYVKALLAKGARHVLVVNDGSDREFDSIFSEISLIEKCTVLRHHKNKGKGRALKTAFAYFLGHFQEMDGVITADADGQHSVEDVFKVANAISSDENEIVLGVRDFQKTHVPGRSQLGNKITSFLFRFLFHYKLEDTQTGLRGIPASQLSWMLQLKGERYEFEINMLIHARLRDIDFRKVPIQTLYFNRNEGSHYHPLFDSLKIFSQLVRGYFYDASLWRKK